MSVVPTKSDDKIPYLKIHFGERGALFKILFEKALNLVKRDEMMCAAVVKVGMRGAGDCDEELIVAFQFGKRVLSHVETVRLVAMNNHHGVTQIFGMGKDAVVHPTFLCLHHPSAV